jgi:hypothetical protein
MENADLVEENEDHLEKEKKKLVVVIYSISQFYSLNVKRRSAI